MNRLCGVCSVFVETDGDVNYDGTRNIEVAVPGKSLRCESCNEFVHTGCAGGDEVCKTCGACDVCGVFAWPGGTWVVRGSIEPAPPIGTNAQELLCPSCLSKRSVAA